MLKDVARYDESLVWLRKGVKRQTTQPSNVLFTLVGMSWSRQSKGWRRHSVLPHASASTLERWRDRIPDPDPHRRLKVGLISPDFCRHAVSYFVEPLLEQWDRSELEISLYSCGEQIDDYSARLQGRPPGEPPRPGR